MERVTLMIGGFVLVLLLLPLMAGSAAATAKDYCEAQLTEYRFPTKIQDETVASPYYNVRDLTQADKDKLLGVLRRKCMLSSDILSEKWDGKTETERSAYFENYALIKQAVTESQYDTIFPNRVQKYTYESFIRAAVAFPYLCGEDGEDLAMCKKEFATMFAHWLQETSGLRYLNEGNCASGGCESFADDAYFYADKAKEADPKPNYQYFGRGPKQLTHNSNYGRFSWQFYNDMRLLESPYLLVEDEYINESFISAFWFYMTPVSQKPSMHEVVTGIWQPNAKDDAANITPGFGTTINIINGGLECGSGAVNPTGAANRIAFYKGGTAQGATVNGTLYDLGLDPAADPSLVENLLCTNQDSFPLGGAGSHALYFNYSRYWYCELSYLEHPFMLYDSTPFKSSLGTVCDDGLDCSQKIQARLKTYPESTAPSDPPFSLKEFYPWLGVSLSGAVATPVDLLLLHD